MTPEEEAALFADIIVDGLKQEDIERLEALAELFAGDGK